MMRSRTLLMALFRASSSAEFVEGDDAETERDPLAIFSVMAASTRLGRSVCKPANLEFRESSSFCTWTNALELGLELLFQVVLSLSIVGVDAGLPAFRLPSDLALGVAEGTDEEEELAPEAFEAGEMESMNLLRSNGLFGASLSLGFKESMSESVSEELVRERVTRGIVKLSSGEAGACGAIGGT